LFALSLLGVLTDRKFVLFVLIIGSFSFAELIEVLRLSEDGFLLKLIIGALANETPIAAGGVPGVIGATTF
jgi:hypothetical protein